MPSAAILTRLRISASSLLPRRHRSSTVFELSGFSSFANVPMLAGGASAASKVAAYLSKLNPVPTFPSYGGPYKVGSVDVEIPVASLKQPSPRPQGAADISTIQFRIFYPAVDDSDGKLVSWLPDPQRHHVSAYTRFLGVGSNMAGILSYVKHPVALLSALTWLMRVSLSFLPRHLHYTSIRAYENVKLRQPEVLGMRWPTMIFSHGLGGGRNSYSFLAGSMASYGVVVVCPEHRDGSAIVSFIHRQGGNGQASASDGPRMIPYRKMSHTVSPEILEAREAQLRIRLWELGLIHEAVLALDSGVECAKPDLLSPLTQQFAGQLDVREPGRIIFSGHSFGATTMVQFLKSTYYANDPALVAMANPLFTLNEGSKLRDQVTERTVAILLDMWCMPLTAPNSACLFDMPLPAYADRPAASGGQAILAIESEAFQRWRQHLRVTARLLSPDPAASSVTPELFERPERRAFAKPNLFYVVRSAHLSHSDFGVLFPRLTKRMFKVDDPEQVLRLNVRAQLQVLRANGFRLAATSPSDLVDGMPRTHPGGAVYAHCDSVKGEILDGKIFEDAAILEHREDNSVNNWRWIDVVSVTSVDSAGDGKTAVEQVAEGEEKMEGEMEPSEQPVDPPQRTVSAVAAL